MVNSAMRLQNKRTCRRIERNKYPNPKAWGLFEKTRIIRLQYMGMDQYLLIPFLGGWTSIYQLFWCSPGVQGFDTLPYGKLWGNHEKDADFDKATAIPPPPATDETRLWLPVDPLPARLDLNVMPLLSIMTFEKDAIRPLKSIKNIIYIWLYMKLQPNNKKET